MGLRGNFEIMAAAAAIFVAWISLEAALGITLFTLVAVGIYRGVEDVRVQKSYAGEALRERVREEAKKKNLDDILKVVNVKGAVSTEEVQDILKISEGTALEYITELERSGKLEHIDHPKGGEDYRMKNRGNE